MTEPSVSEPLRTFGVGDGNPRGRFSRRIHAAARLLGVVADRAAVAAVAIAATVSRASFPGVCPFLHACRSSATGGSILVERTSCVCHQRQSSERFPDREQPNPHPGIQTLQTHASTCANFELRIRFVLRISHVSTGASEFRAREFPLVSFLCPQFLCPFSCPSFSAGILAAPEPGRRRLR